MLNYIFSILPSILISFLFVLPWGLILSIRGNLRHLRYWLIISQPTRSLFLFSSQNYDSLPDILIRTIAWFDSRPSWQNQTSWKREEEKLEEEKSEDFRCKRFWMVCPIWVSNLNCLITCLSRFSIVEENYITVQFQWNWSREITSFWSFLSNSEILPV